MKRRVFWFPSTPSFSGEGSIPCSTHYNVELKHRRFGYGFIIPSIRCGYGNHPKLHNVRIGESRIINPNGSGKCGDNGKEKEGDRLKSTQSSRLAKSTTTNQQKLTGTTRICYLSRRKDNSVMTNSAGLVEIKVGCVCSR